MLGPISLLLASDKHWHRKEIELELSFFCSKGFYKLIQLPGILYILYFNNIFGFYKLTLLILKHSWDIFKIQHY